MSPLVLKKVLCLLQKLDLAESKHVFVVVASSSQIVQKFC